MESLNPQYPGQLLTNPPPWVPANLQEYKSSLSMSSVSVSFNLEPSIPRGWFHCIRNMRGIDIPQYGMIIDVSDANNTTKMEDLFPTPPRTTPKKGRNPINTRVEPRRPHGDYRSFGRSIEVKLIMHLDMAFKSSTDREYTIKIFPKKIQVPGCFDEHHRDVNKIVEFIFHIFRIGYSQVPDVPLGFDMIQAELHRYGLQPLIHMRRSDIETLQIIEVEVYSRNYTFHYAPLVDNKWESGDQKHVLNLDSINDHIIKDANATAAILRQYGVPNMATEYTGISETANRRLQFIFGMPKNASTPDKKKKMEMLTKAYLEASGKLNIDLGNSYIYTDVLWRIFSVISRFITPNFIQSRMPTGSRTMTGDIIKLLIGKTRSEDEIRKFIASQITPPPTDDEDEF